MANFLFTADIHANKERLPKIIKFFEKCKTIITDNKIDYFVIGGDLWNAAIQNTKASGFVDVLKELNDISTMTHIIALLGTPHHEPFGSLDFIKSIGGEVITETTVLEKNGVKILCIPEPRRANYMRPTAQEITDAMNEDLDKAFNNKVDVVFYHGEISGAVLQNDTKAKCNVQVTQSMFERCGAKLLLAGHIHSPQTIGENMHYVGSPIGCSFKEGHEGSVILFSCKNGNVSDFRRVYLDFPVNKLLDIESLDLFRKLDKFKFNNSNVKIRLKLTPEEKLTFNIREEAKKLKEATGASEVVLHISSRSDVSIRSKEIAKVSSVEDKLKIYAEVNDIELTPSIMDKAKYIQDNMLIKYQFPTHSFELLKVELKGVKGIKNHDNIVIDFSEYDNGIIALVGANGAGKSTLIELATPYPKMLTRNGALRNYFFLKDSHRIVTYRDENNLWYKFVTNIAGHIDNGLVEYFAYTSNDEGETWTKMDGIDGKLDTYKQIVTELFGDQSVYLRTAFFTKGKVKGVNDIATAGKTERLELFSQLIGTDNLSAMHSMIKDEMQSITKQMEGMDNIEEKCIQIESKIKEKLNIEKVLSKNLSDIESELSGLENEIVVTKEKQEEFTNNIGRYGDLINLKNETENRISELTEHLDKLKEHKKKNDFFKNHTKQIDEYKEVYSTLKPLEEECSKITKKYREYYEAFVAANNNLHDASSRRDTDQSKYEKADYRIENAKKNIIPIEECCPTCGAKLSASKKKQLLKAQEYQNAELESLIQFKEAQKKILDESKDLYKIAKSEFTKAEKKKDEYQKKFDDIDGKLMSTKTYLDMNDLMDYVEYIPVDNLEKDISDITKEIDHCKELLSTFDGIEIIDYKAKLNELETKRKTDENLRLKLSMDIASVQTEVKTFREQLDDMDNKRELMKVLSKDFEEYSVLKQAFANTGIQALELEAAAPEIQLLTNQILLDGYGDKFSIEIKTLKDGRNKIIDDCEIMVTNHETGWTIPIDELSEGEKVWVMQSLYYTFSIIRMNKTGFNFKVRFIDESDGSLDSEMRLKYVAMINSVHNAGNARLTVMITHSTEVKNIVNQIIQL